jgi:hypothetical protein
MTWTTSLLLFFMPLPLLFLLPFALVFPALFPHLLSVSPLFNQILLTAFRHRFRALRSRSKQLLLVLLANRPHPVHEPSVDFRMA